MYLKINNNSVCMQDTMWIMFVYQNTNISYIYKIQNIVFGVSLIENHNLRDIVIIAFCLTLTGASIPSHEYRIWTNK